MTKFPTPKSRNRALSERSIEHANNFLSTLFMAIRTGQIHEPSNAAFGNAIRSLHAASQLLVASTGGFSITFVDGAPFLNGVLLPLTKQMGPSCRALAEMLHARQLGGIEMSTSPNYETLQNLVTVLGSRDKVTDKRALDEIKREIGMLGVQQLADDAQGMKVDRRIFAVQCYAKLILALREQFDRLRAPSGAAHAEVRPPRIRIVRVVQDLIEISAERPDLLLRLALTTKGASPVELLGAGACLVTVCMGQALGLPRRDLSELGVAALFHAIGMTSLDPHIPNEAERDASMARVVGGSGPGRSTCIRAFVLFEQMGALPQGSSAKELHPFSRIVAAAVEYCRLTTGFGSPSGKPVHPLHALAKMHNDLKRRFDRRMIDLLINVMRAFPAGTEVALGTGERAFVTRHSAHSRWDCPMVASEAPGSAPRDLMRGASFEQAIVGTTMFIGQRSASVVAKEEFLFSPALDPEELGEIVAPRAADDPSPIRLATKDLIRTEGPPITLGTKDLLLPVDAPIKLATRDLVPLESAIPVPKIVERTPDEVEDLFRALRSELLD